jgi:hypothetical protein
VKIIKQPVELLGVPPMKAQTIRGARAPADQSALQVSLKVHDKVKASRTYLAEEGTKAFPPTTPVKQDDFIHGRVILHERKGGGLNRPGKFGLGVGASNKVCEWKGASHVPNRTVKDNKNPMRTKGHPHLASW